jgi:filamentous hemagglutinin family protein
MIHTKTSTRHEVLIGIPRKTVRMKAVAWTGLLAGLLGAGSGYSQSFNSQIDAIANSMANSFKAAELPSGGRVVVGQAKIQSQHNFAGTVLTNPGQWLTSTMHVTQATDKAVIDWNSFSVGRNATVNFHHRSDSAVTLNRVTGTQKSVIDGAINASGQVYVLNANGVLFGKTAKVNVGGLVASTLGLSNEDFMAEKITLAGNGRQGRVDNEGVLKATDGGYIALVGKQVGNYGAITANFGRAALLAGDTVSLKFQGKSLWGAFVDKGTLQALVHNKGTVIADDGRISLNASGTDAVKTTVIKNTGRLQARSLVRNNSAEITLEGDRINDQVEVGGTLDLNPPHGYNRGSVTLYAAHLVVERAAIQNRHGISTLLGWTSFRRVDRIEP